MIALSKLTAMVRMKPMLQQILLLATFLALPIGAANAAWTLKVISSFNGTNGSIPTGGLIFDPAGNLYGTTAAGGKANAGTVFRLMPHNAGKTAWIETVLASFNGGSNGSRPYGADLIRDMAGNLYGATEHGGKFGLGAVFKLALPAAGKIAWTETVLLSFSGGSNGSHPNGALISDATSNFYGTAQLDGNDTACPGNSGQGVLPGCGVVYKLTPPAAGGTAWTETVLAAFSGADGSHPQGALIFDAAGGLYGTTAAGGKTGAGTVFRLNPPAAGQTRWTKTILTAFNETDGSSPSANLIFDAAGNLYGTTYSGGTFGFGTVFKLTPPAVGKTTWKKTVIASFNWTDGACPDGGLVFDAAGNLYGTTTEGGSSGAAEGAVFKLTPPRASNGAWTETVIAAFDGATYGSAPIRGLVFDKAGNLYGTASGYGPSGHGTVFELTP